MAKFQPGESVYVPAASLPDPNRPFALVKKQVERVEKRSIIVTDGGASVSVASSRSHDPRLGFLVLKIGDLKTEATLLNPLARSVLEFFHLLLPEDNVRRLDVRTEEELEAFWSNNHDAYSHVVLIGHSDESGMGFLNSVRSGAELGALFGRCATGTVRPKHFVSLACASGRATFAKAFSQQAVCERFVGPFDDVHGATASHFCQTYFAGMLLEGRTAKTAFNRAAALIMGVTHFRLWRGGTLVAGKKLK